MPERFRAAGEEQLARHEEVVRDRVSGEVREVAVGNGSQPSVPRAGQDPFTHMQDMTVPSVVQGILGKGKVRGNRTVQETLRVGAQQIGDGPRDEVQRIQQMLTEEDVRGRPERPGRIRQEREKYGSYTEDG